jgi:hypothetical protein
MTAKLTPLYEYSQLVISPPLFEAEKVTVAFDPLHEVEFDTPEGTPIYVKPPLSVLANVLGLVKTMLEAPLDFAGVRHVIDVDELNTTEVQVEPPIVTAAPETKSVPVRVIDVPPTVVPNVGETLNKVGGTA